MSSDPAYDACSKAKRQYESGNVQGAVDTLEEYLKTDPHNCKVRLQLAQHIIYGLKDMKYGMMQLDIILDIDPDYYDALAAQVAVLSENKKNNKETDAKFQRLLEINPSADMYNTYARFLRNQMVDFPKAAEYYEKAIALAPGRYEYHQNYAALLLNDLKDYEKARQELEILMELKPDDWKVKQNYERLMREKFDKDGKVKKSRFGFLKRRSEPLAAVDALLVPAVDVSAMLALGQPLDGQRVGSVAPPS
jgi:tetratricopeptide (TPR) repeat protein